MRVLLSHSTPSVVAKARDLLGGISSVVLRPSRFEQSICKIPPILTNPNIDQFVAIRGIHGLCGIEALISGVCVRTELIFPYVIFVIFKYIYVFAFIEIKALRSLGSE